MFQPPSARSNPAREPAGGITDAGSKAGTLVEVKSPAADITDGEVSGIVGREGATQASEKRLAQSRSHASFPAHRDLRK